MSGHSEIARFPQLTAHGCAYISVRTYIYTSNTRVQVHPRLLFRPGTLFPYYYVTDAAAAAPVILCARRRAESSPVTQFYTARTPVCSTVQCPAGSVDAAPPPTFGLLRTRNSFRGLRRIHGHRRTKRRTQLASHRNVASRRAYTRATGDRAPHT